jgi:hypothetical protein
MDQRNAHTELVAPNAKRMKPLLSVSIAVSAAVLACPAWADAQLANKKNCLACHQNDKKVVGPSVGANTCSSWPTPAASCCSATTAWARRWWR